MSKLVKGRIIEVISTFSLCIFRFFVWTRWPSLHFFITYFRYWSKTIYLLKV